MRKILVMVLLAGLAWPVIADDAKILPAGVLRITLAPSYGFAPGVYDTSGSYAGYSSGGGRATVFNAGAAIEYGVTDWISAAVQWAPGVNFTSSVDTNWAPLPNTGSSANVNGPFALFTGAEFQFVGEKAPVKSETIRFALAAGVKIPFGGTDFANQYNSNYPSGGAVTVANADKQALGVGGRLFADWVFSKAFFLNLYSEFIYYPGTVAFKDTSFQDYAMYAASGNTYNPKVGYGYDFTLEMEPHYAFDLSSDNTLEASLPFTLTHSPDLTYDGAVQTDTFSSLLVVRPTLDLFLMKSPIPFPVEFKLAYSLPLIGWNTVASNALIFVMRVYLMF